MLKHSSNRFVSPGVNTITLLRLVSSHLSDFYLLQNFWSILNLLSLGRGTRSLSLFLLICIETGEEGSRQCGVA